MSLLLKLSWREAFVFTLLLSLCIPAEGAKPKAEWADSPLSAEVQVKLTGAGKLMKSGRYEKAKPIVLAALASANDVPKCLAIAEFTETYAFPMMEVRRQCCNKALSLCASEEDYLLIELKARHYQFYEITRQAVTKLTTNAATVQQLYTLAQKAHEVSLNDVAHMALEKAASGLKTGADWFTYAENCKAIGMDDLLRKAIKLLIDEEDDSSALCDLALRMQRYCMRDETRYCLRKALDKVSSDLPTATREMAVIAEAARQLNEPDVKARADYFVKKGNNMMRQRGLDEEADRKTRAERERQSLDDARLKDKERDQSGFGGEIGAPNSSQPAAGQAAAAPPGKPSTGY